MNQEKEKEIINLDSGTVGIGTIEARTSWIWTEYDQRTPVAAPVARTCEHYTVRPNSFSGRARELTVYRRDTAAAAGAKGSGGEGVKERSRPNSEEFRCSCWWSVCVEVRLNVLFASGARSIGRLRLEDTGRWVERPTKCFRPAGALGRGENSARCWGLGIQSAD
ncbi:hypothetical protein R1flu_016338 [Riccia fluitans]|uniref:Uncharacterized protein n=1 Tax=Riccia fluitans TaxID=41844 RepID=A0ABD1YLJ7_9MARC